MPQRDSACRLIRWKAERPGRSLAARTDDRQAPANPALAASRSGNVRPHRDSVARAIRYGVPSSISLPSRNRICPAISCSGSMRRRRLHTQVDAGDAAGLDALRYERSALRRGGAAVRAFGAQYLLAAGPDEQRLVQGGEIAAVGIRHRERDEGVLLAVAVDVAADGLADIRRDGFAAVAGGGLFEVLADLRREILDPVGEIDRGEGGQRQAQRGNDGSDGET
jgi:hypothetical protein